MTQKVPVDKLQIGMYVAALDRDWSDVPFKPPFELQAFTISSDADIAEVKKHCEYVHVDLTLSSHAKGKTVATEALELQSVPGSPAVSASSSASAKQDSSAQLDSGESRARILYREQRYDGDGGTAPVNAELHDNGTTVSEEVTPVEASSAGDVVYPDLVPVEVEIETAREIIGDTEAVFKRVAKDIKDGEKIDTAAVKKNVETLVQSVVRNPDALSWLTRLKQQDGYTYSHAMAVCVLALTIGRHLGLPVNAMHDLGVGALLQDVGKLRIPTELLEKVNDLNESERFTISRHVDLSLNLLESSPDFPPTAIDIVKHHHERFDGTGYPEGLQGDSISPFAVIAGMADTYEAMTNRRPYRPALNSYEALGELYQMRDKLFPKAMVENLINCVGVFPVGSFVELNTLHIGVVIGRNQVKQLKPKVMVLLDPDGRKLPTSPTVDLAAQKLGDPSIPSRILRVVDPKDYGVDPRDFFV